MRPISGRALLRLRHSALQENRRCLSSQIQSQKNDNEQDNEFSHKQDFVKIQFEPGEWDPNKEDPLFKPPFKSRAKIMSAEEVNPEKLGLLMGGGLVD